MELFFMVSRCPSGAVPLTGMQWLAALGDAETPRWASCFGSLLEVPWTINPGVAWGLPLLAPLISVFGIFPRVDGYHVCFCLAEH